MADRIWIGDGLVDPAKSTIVLGDQDREVDASHLAVLMLLVEHAGRPVDKASLLERGWESRHVSEENLNVAVSKLRDALGDDLQQPKIICAAGDHGFELLADVRREQEEGGRFSRLPLMLLVVLVLTVLWINKDRLLGWIDGAPSAPLDLPQSLAVMPFEAGVEKEHHAMVGGLAPWLVETLEEGSDPPELRAFASSQRAPENRVDAARALGADTILVGSLSRERNDYVLTASLYSVQGRRLFHVKEKLALDDLNEVMADLVRKTRLIFNPSLLDREIENPELPDSTAFYGYLSALDAAQKGRLDSALNQLDVLVTAFPEHTAASLKQVDLSLRRYAGDPVMLRKQAPELLRRLHEAEAQAPEHAEVYRLKGALQFLHNWDFEAAEKAYLKASALAPNDPAIAYELVRYHLCFGNINEAMEQLDKLKRLDPLGYDRIFAAWAYNMARRFEDALLELNDLAEEQPDHLELAGAYLRTYESMREEQKAYDHYQKLFARLGYTEQRLSEMDQRFADGGLAAVNRSLIDNFEDGDMGQYAHPLAVARYCAAANDKLYAFNWLESALANKQLELLWLRLDPKYDSLRSDERFADLVDRIFPPN